MLTDSSAVPGRRPHRWTPVAQFLLFTAALALIAALSPAPDRITDRDIYEAAAARTILPDCTDLHCFRVLVPWVLGTLPAVDGKWKMYAVVCNAGAAVALFQLCLACGFRRRAAWLAAVSAAFGFGSLYTLHDPHTSDPLMYLLGPVMTTELVRGRIELAAVIGAAGVLAKEIAAVPLFVFFGSAVLERRWLLAGRALASAMFVFIVWTALQLTLMLRFNYGYGDSASTQLLSGGNLLPWMSRQSGRGALVAVFNEYGAMYLLAPVGLIWFASPLLRRLALAAIPPALLFAYVQQPDRALWNFHYLMLPFGALLLNRVEPALAWSTVGAFAVANLRVGAQLPFVPGARWALGCSIVLALSSIALAFRRRTSTAPPANAPVGPLPA
jgi:hypothetical protein